VVVYLDDIVDNNNKLEDYVVHLKDIFNVMCDIELYVKVEKCSLDQEDVHFLRHIIGGGQLGWRPKRYKQPKSGRLLQRYSNIAFSMNWLIIITCLLKATQQK